MRTLVIDVGTSGVRTAIVHDDTSISDLVHEPLLPSTPAPGLVEFDADLLWDVVLRLATTASGPAPVDAVGITNQRASVIGWRRSTGRPFGPAIGWQDLRTVGECIMAKITHGIGLAPNQSATKIVWLASNHLSDAERDSNDIVYGTVDTWLTWKLSNGTHHVTDATNAAVTGLTTPDGLSWDDKVLGALGIHRHQLPVIVPTSGDIAVASTLPGSPPITALVGDQQASLVGQGCITPGRAKITFGTGGMLDMFVGPARPTSSTRSGGGTFPIVARSTADEALYGVEGVMLAAGTNVEWLVEDMGLLASPQESDAIAASVPSTDGVVYVPALLGLGTPHWDYGARGTLLGLTRGTTRAHIVRAVLEGIAHRGVDLIEAAERDSGLRIDMINIDGGMSRNTTFVQALADASGRTVSVSPVTEATTLGAGLLAGTSAGQWGTLADAAALMTGFRQVAPLGQPGIARQQWGEAVSRSRSWIPDLSSLDF